MATTTQHIPGSGGPGPTTLHIPKTRDGDYGVCYCGKRVYFTRLVSNPAAATCKNGIKNYLKTLEES